MLVVLVLLVSIFIVTGQLLLKIGIGSIEESDPSSTLIYVWNLVKTPYFILAGISLTISGLIWIYVVRSYELSLAYPLTSMSYILMLVGSYLLFDEEISLSKILGVLIIVVGIIVLTMGSQPAEA